MSRPGEVVLFRFPQADLQAGRLRPALVLGRLPGDYGDLLICMISSRLRHEVSGFDEVISPDQEDFVRSGLKVASLIRVGRLAVVEPSMLVGSIGRIDEKRVLALRMRLAGWLEAMPDER